MLQWWEVCYAVNFGGFMRNLGPPCSEKFEKGEGVIGDGGDLDVDEAEGLAGALWGHD
jgi:hypothetical protein